MHYHLLPGVRPPGQPRETQVFGRGLVDFEVPIFPRGGGALYMFVTNGEAPGATPSRFVRNPLSRQFELHCHSITSFLVLEGGLFCIKEIMLQNKAWGEELVDHMFFAVIVYALAMQSLLHVSF